jgi:hypothetical protein
MEKSSRSCGKEKRSCPPRPRYDDPSGSEGTHRTTPYLINPAFGYTHQGADPDAADLGWCIRRRWRVIYYAYRHTAGLPLWSGADAFERLMAEILCRLTRGLEPIAPLPKPVKDRPEDQLLDARSERFQQPLCRIFRTPRFDRPGWDR